MNVFNYYRYKIFLFIPFFIILFANYSNSQDPDYLKSVIERINELEIDLRNIQEKKGILENSNTTNKNNVLAGHEQRLLELEEEIRTLNGNLEDLSFKIDNINKTLEKLDFSQEKQNKIKENNFTYNSQNQNADFNKDENVVIEQDPNSKKNPSMKVLGTINENTKEDQESKLSENQQKINPPEEEILGQKPITEDTLKLMSKNPSEIYDYAYDMLLTENFMEAEKSFKAFIGEHPNHTLASNAYYWLGETYYVQKNFQLAAISFARGFQNFPKGNKALDQLFKLALTFMNLGKNEDACAAFSKLESEFPNAPKRISNRAKEYIKRAKC